MQKIGKNPKKFYKIIQKLDEIIQKNLTTIIYKSGYNYQKKKKMENYQTKSINLSKKLDKIIPRR